MRPRGISGHYAGQVWGVRYNVGILNAITASIANTSIGQGSAGIGFR